MKGFLTTFLSLSVDSTTDVLNRNLSSQHASFYGWLHPPGGNMRSSCVTFISHMLHLFRIFELFLFFLLKGIYFACLSSRSVLGYWVLLGMAGSWTRRACKLPPPIVLLFASCSSLAPRGNREGRAA